MLLPRALFSAAQRAFRNLATPPLGLAADAASYDNCSQDVSIPILYYVMPHAFAVQVPGRTTASIFRSTYMATAAAITHNAFASGKRPLERHWLR